MNRSEFLSKFWKPYPAIKGSALDVSSAFSFLSSQRSESDVVLVGGRLRGKVGEFSLVSGGAAVAVQFDQNCKWFDLSLEFSEKLLASGDQVLIRARYDFVMDAAVFHVCEAQLLAPAIREMKHKSSELVDTLGSWSKFLNSVRAYFLANNFIECQTPTLVPAPGTEPYLDVFTTQLEYGEKVQQFYLPTSPEFHLKKLLAQGVTRAFEIRSCFRNGEITEHHQPEFQMLEWYRAYAGLDSIVQDLRGLFIHLQRTFPEKKVPQIKVTTMAELFKKYCRGFALTPDVSLNDLKDLCAELSLHTAPDDTWDDLFFRLVIDRIEPQLDPDVPLIVRGYPKPQAALARISETGWAERFEFYWKGLEIANAFDELNDPEQNEKRFETDMQKRIASGRQKHSFDSELIESFYSGMPPAGGIALGMERLYMAIFDVRQISQIKPFPVTRPY